MKKVINKQSLYNRYQNHYLQLIILEVLIKEKENDYIEIHSIYNQIITKHKKNINKSDNEMIYFLKESLNYLCLIKLIEEDDEKYKISHNGIKALQNGQLHNFAASSFTNFETLTIQRKINCLTGILVVWGFIQSSYYIYSMFFENADLYSSTNLFFKLYFFVKYILFYFMI